jgi:hypothetical protein
MIFTPHAQIYVNGLGAWFRIIDQTDDKVRLVNSDGYAKWESKAEIESLMEKDEPSLCTDGDL